LSRQAHDDYPPAEPIDWADGEPANEPRRRRATGGGVGKRPRARKSRRGRAFAAVAGVLVVLAAGGIYEANMAGWLDLGAMLPGGSGPRARPAVGADAERLVFSGKADELASPAGNLVQQDRSDSSVTWIRSSIKQAGPAGQTDGASLEIKPPLATDLVGRRIRVTISARAPDQGTPVPFAAAYSSANAGTSGWIVFTPTKEFDDYAFEYQVPTTVGTAQHIGIWSDISGRGAPLAVRSIAIRRLD
jgi:hypothetical protein